MVGLRIMSHEKSLAQFHYDELDELVSLSIRDLIAAAITGDCTGEPVAAFLMAWHDPENHGGFNLSDLWVMNEKSRKAAVVLFGWLSKNHIAPHELGLQIVFNAIAARWAY